MSPTQSRDVAAVLLAKAGSAVEAARSQAAEAKDSVVGAVGTVVQETDRRRRRTAKKARRAARATRKSALLNARLARKSALRSARTAQKVAVSSARRSTVQAAKGARDAAVASSGDLRDGVGPAGLRYRELRRTAARTLQNTPAGGSSKDLQPPPEVTGARRAPRLISQRGQRPRDRGPTRDARMREVDREQNQTAAQQVAPEQNHPKPHARKQHAPKQRKVARKAHASRQDLAAKRQRRSHRKLKVLFVLALGGAVAAAVRILRPTRSGGTGASIPPKMRPVPSPPSDSATGGLPTSNLDESAVRPTAPFLADTGADGPLGGVDPVPSADDGLTESAINPVVLTSESLPADAELLGEVEEDKKN